MLLKVSRSAYYAARTAGPSKHARDDQDLTEAIAAVHDESDGTYIPTWEGWLYLATVIDLTSRRVVGWATADICAPT